MTLGLQDFLNLRRSIKKKKKTNSSKLITAPKAKCDTLLYKSQNGTEQMPLEDVARKIARTGKTWELRLIARGNGARALTAN